MKLNKPLFAIAISYLGFIPLEIYTQIMKYYGLTNVSGLESMSMMWIPEGSLVLGVLAGLGIGAWYSLITYYSVKIWGTDYFPIKAALLAMTSEALMFSIYGVLARNPNLTQDVSGNYVHASAEAIGGICVGLLLKRFLFSHRTL